MSSPPKNILILGGGIIGSSTAYFLAHHARFSPTTTSITILEATRIAGGASGKAGGLLALWAYPQSIVPLSFRLHRELAEKHGGKERWGYRGVYAGQLDVKVRDIGKPRTSEVEKGGGGAVSLQKLSKEAKEQRRKAGVPDDLDWVDAGDVKSYEAMGDPSTTAQVHPYQFTTAMVELAQEKGVKVVFGSAQQINEEDGAVKSVTYKDKETGEVKELPADVVVLAAGAWCPKIVPSVPITPLRAHSVTIRPTRPVSAHVLFTGIDIPGQATDATPEIYARPNNEVYACGEGDTLVDLPPSTDNVEVVDSRCQDIVEYVGAISDELRNGQVTARQACYLPIGGPLIGNLRTKGLILASGHTCWGIQNAPGTGLCVAELILDGKVRSAKIGGLDPQKVM